MKQKVLLLSALIMALAGCFANGASLKNTKRFDEMTLAEKMDSCSHAEHAPGLMSDAALKEKSYASRQAVCEDSTDIVTGTVTEETSFCQNGAIDPIAPLKFRTSIWET